MHLLTIRFGGPFWTRILNELKASGLFAQPMANNAAMQSRLLSLRTSPTPQRWR
jgi:hypothetical protein